MLSVISIGGKQDDKRETGTTPPGTKVGYFLVFTMV
jgi:hypothetical protein